MAYPDVTGVSSRLGETPANDATRLAVALPPREGLRRWRRPVLAGLVRAWVPKAIHERTPLEEVARRDRPFRRSLAVADVVAAALSLAVCAVAFGDLRLQAPAVLALPLVVVAGRLQGIYDRDGL